MNLLPTISRLLVTSLLAALVGCGGDGTSGPSAVTCGSRGGSGNAGVCTWQFNTCSDGADYQVQCTTAPGPSTCTCFVNSVRTASFTTCSVCGNLYTGDLRTVNTGCGWTLASSAEGAAPPAQCASDAGADTGVDAPTACRGAGSSCTGTCCPGLQCIGFSGFRPGVCG